MPPISDAEAQVMQVLWQTGRASTDDIAQALQGSRDWQLTTVKTLLNRLLNKGAITAERDGRRYLYSPLLTQDEWLGSQSLSLLDRLFDGRLAPLVAHFGAHRALEAADVRALKKLIKNYERG
jgi:BlaI family transcriptional regulator, penicillinase repressor